MVDDTARVEVGKDMLVVLSANHPHDLVGLQQGVGHDVLVGDHTLGQTEDCYLALGLAAPDLHLVVRQLKAGHAVHAVKGGAEFWTKSIIIINYSKICVNDFTCKDECAFSSNFAHRDEV